MILSPSLLSSDFGNLEKELKTLASAGVTWVHWDIMDGSFVPNITFGAPVIKKLRPISPLFFDVHLMIVEPERHIEAFADAGADLIVVHAEAVRHLDRVLHQIKDLGIKAGVSLNPATPLCVLENVFDIIDLVLIMSVNPGFGGQSFIPRAYEKISSLSSLLHSNNSSALIEVDGGVTPENTQSLVSAGADVLVSGSAFFSSPSYEERLALFAKEASKSTRVPKGLDWHSSKA